MIGKRIALAATTTNNGSTGAAKPVDEVAVCVNDELTCINDDIPVVTNVRPMASIDTNDLCKTLCETRTHELKNILARPTLVNTFNWSTASIAATPLLTNLSFPSAFLTNVMIANKVSGFLGFKGKLILTLQINPERFHQGRLIMNWFPQNTYATGSRVAVSNNRLVYSTQLPNVQFDCATNSTVQLEVDYVSPTVAYDLIDGEGQMGGVSVIVYSPLVTVLGATTLTCKLWAHYEDVTLAFPLRPQSMKTAVVRRNLVKTKTEMEEVAAGIGPISSILAATSIYADALKGVPLLSSIVAPVSWASAILARAASSFGFSKPMISAPQHRVVSSKFPYSMNSTGTDSSQNLGMFADTKVADYPNFGATNVDELSIHYVTQVPSHLISFNWSNGSLTDTLLFSTQLSPNVMVTTRTFGGTVVVDPSPIFYISNMFQLWRGSYTFNIKFVKTEFHSGRLIFAYEPNPVNNLPTTLNCNYMYKEILDLRTSNEFSITVPYISVHPYLEVQGTLQETASGRVWLFIETPLQAPTTVASSIDIIMEVAAGPDFEVAVPVSPIWVPVTFSGGPLPNIVAPGKDLEVDLSEEKEAFYAQALGTNVMPNQTQTSDGKVINGEIDSGGLTPSMLCIGERVLSIRQLLKRSILYYSREQAGALNDMIFSPQLISVCSIGTLGAVNSPPVLIDNINYFGLLYRYHRGGINIRFYTNETGQNNFAGTINPKSDVLAFPTNASSIISDTTNPVAFGTSSIGGGVEINVPNYSRWPFNPIYEQTSLSSTTPLPFAANNLVRVKSSQNITTPFIFRQAADDFSFGYFIGTVPMIQKTVTILASATTKWA
jgi:hypothetical protein